jgi:DNA-binding NarL/FixJ family response regulator
MVAARINRTWTLQGLGGAMELREPARPVPIGLVEYASHSPDDFHAEDLGFVVRWQVAPDEIQSAIRGRAVDRVILHCHFDDADAAMSAVQRVRAAHSDTPVWLALSYGEVVLLANVVSVVGRPTGTPGSAPASLETLTVRERQILRMIRAGLTNRDISHGLAISISTVNRHVEHIFLKLGVRNRTQAAVLVRQPHDGSRGIPA